ncbi:HK97 family phage major capsid protein [Streptomyces sp. SAI-144]|uniref:phage major capsid protein n=1 Tax=Streptomyces sp. SAI-144 TaxID=2940544 RepID=UPI002476D391|nr:phage major capsid protein [Streptomyces sp. SAI-144]MDH6432609.1 HK97 family phage major capsid protein [Streptomyces sp. SAI-144]
MTVSLPHLRAARSQLRADIDGILATVKAENRKNLTPDEEQRFQATMSDIEVVDRQIDQAEEAERRGARAADVRARFTSGGPQATGLQVTSNENTYRKGDVHGFSWVKDMTAVALRQDADAAQRLQRNTREVALETRALSTTDGAGGEFVPPLWLVNEAVTLARAARVAADQVRKLPLPPGTDSVNLPRVVTGTTTAEQTSQNTGVSNTDATTNSIAANVATIAGQQVVSQQLIDQSPVNMDDVLLADLTADYAVKLDTFVLSNNAANKRGLLNVSGLNAITYTDASPTVGELYSKGADAIQQIHTGRFLPPDKVFMHPRRWAWFTAALDTAGRPLVVPVANMPQNVLAAMGDVVSEGFVGTWQGLPVYVDPNIPINLGAGTNEDRIIVLRSADVLLYEGVLRAEAFRETKADQLSVLLRVYNYAALHSERYPKAISVIAGTGLVTPTF